MAFERKGVPSISLDNFEPGLQCQLKDYQCMVCCGIYNFPVIDRCGHIFCRTCISDHLSRAKLCPLSKKPIRDSLRKIETISKALDKYKISCPLKIKGCKWVGVLSNYEEHVLNECGRLMVKCKHRGCEVVISRDQQDQHLGQCNFCFIDCPNKCGEKILEHSIDEHNLSCSKYEIYCPQNCGFPVLREDVENHIKFSCQSTILSCPFKEANCNFDFKEETRKLEGNSKKELDYNNFLTYDKLVMLEKKWDDRYEMLEKKLDNLMNTDSLCHSRYCLSLLKPNLDDYERQTSTQLMSNFNLSPNTDNISMCIQEQEIQERIEDKASETQLEIVNKEKEDMSTLTELILNSLSKEESHKSKEEHIVKQVTTVYKREKRTCVIRSETQMTTRLTKNKITNIVQPKSQTKLELDKKNSSCDVKIYGSLATVSRLEENTHKFVYGLKPLRNDYYTWRVTLESYSNGWLAIGACNRDLATSNDFKFLSNEIDFKNGLFLLSSNGYIWNSNNSEQDCLQIQDPPIFSKGAQFDFEFKPEEATLSIKCNDFEIFLLNLDDTEKVYPCVVFLNVLSSVRFSTISD